MLFPKCSHEDNLPLPVCRSVCQNERLHCRRSGSNFGTWNEIRDACAAEPFVDEAGPSEDCTGSANVQFAITYLYFVKIFALWIVIGIFLSDSRFKENL